MGSQLLDQKTPFQHASSSIEEACFCTEASMLRPQRSCWRLLLPAATVLFLILLVGGCGTKKQVTLTGKLILPPNIKLAEKEMVQITFTPVDEGEKPVGAQFTNSDMSFICKNIVPGKYKVSVSLGFYKGMPDMEKREYEFKQFNKSHTEKMNLTFDVISDAEQKITIDLANGKVYNQ
jgi:hypothetical protein